MAPVWIGEDKLTLLDTPGLIDFHGEVERALDVADVAVLVVSAVDGVQGDFVATWDLAREADVPVVIFVNALDAERADFESTLRSLELLVGPTLAPLELPIGVGPATPGRRRPSGRRGHPLRQRALRVTPRCPRSWPTWNRGCARV